MRTYKVIQAEIADFEVEIERLRKEAKEAQARETGDARKKIAELMKASGLTAEDVLNWRTVDKSKVVAGNFGEKKPKIVRKPKYQDPASGKTWSGSGRSPLWFDVNDREKFLIKAA